jgi:putative transposase
MYGASLTVAGIFWVANGVVAWSIEEAQNQATQWIWTYNNERPNPGIGGITPAMKLKTAA